MYFVFESEFTCAVSKPKIHSLSATSLNICPSLPLTACQPLCLLYLLPFPIRFLFLHLCNFFLQFSLLGRIISSISQLGLLNFYFIQKPFFSRAPINSCSLFFFSIYLSEFFLSSWNAGVSFTVCNIYFAIFIGKSNGDLVGNGEFVMGGGAGGRVEVVKSNGCSWLSVGLPSPLPSSKALQPFEPASPAVSSIGSEAVARSGGGPFAGLVICVTGLSKEARKQVKEATERLSGQYSTQLDPQCTHLVVQSFGGRKFEHALKHGSKNGPSIVTIGWFVDSVRKNVRLSESLYSIKSFGENGMRLDELNRFVGLIGTENTCLPVGVHGAKQLDTIEVPRFSFPGRESTRSADSSHSTLSGHSMYVDLDISSELRKKVTEAANREGATFVDQWFVGCKASHVVCEGSSSRKYLGHSSNIVTPLWVLKTAKEKYVQRLVHMSADLARQVGMMLEELQNGIADGETDEGKVPEDVQAYRNKASHEKRQQIVNSAKTGVRNRRGLRMQTCQMPMRPITPSSLLDSICWSISEPTSTASIYTESVSAEDGSEHHTSIFFDAKGDGKDSEASFANLTRPLKESEKSELIFKSHFLTILFPVDRFAEMGPSSRTFVSDNGFKCLQVLDHIYAFYQENMSALEIESAIHTDSRHADRLRSAYSSKETAERGYAIFRRIDFVGSRKSFEMLKRVNGENNSNVYELLIRA